MAKILAVANQKGGVGKTTTCVNLAAALDALRKRVLLVDLDPQGNATMGSGVDASELAVTCGDVLLDQIDPSLAVLEVEHGNYKLLPGNGELTTAEIGLLELPEREVRLKNALDAIKGDYDYIIIDCPPSLSMLTINALVAATGVIIPMQCEYYALEGLLGLVDTIDQLQATANPGLQIEGIIRTMYDSRNRLTNEVSEQLSTHFGKKVYKTVIPRNVRLAEAPSFGMSIIHYEKRSQGSKSYLALAKEMIARDKRAAKKAQQVAKKAQQAAKKKKKAKATEMA